MEENKRPWANLFNAALWAVLLWTRMDTYFDLLPIHGKIFSPEVWRDLQTEYIALFLIYAALILLSLLRFFLYNRKMLLRWAEAITVTLICICGAVGLLLHPVLTNIWVWLFGAVLLAVCIWSWRDLWKHYRTPA